MHFSALKKLLFSLISFLILFAFVTTPQAHAAGDCASYTLPVQLSVTDPTIYHIVGTLCNADDTTKVQLLLSGASYSHVYWDFPFAPQNYSYVANTKNTDFATFNIDRIGTGASDHPAIPEEITIESNAFVAHQIVQDLKNGIIGGKTFTKVVLVGHSMGSAMAINEAATHQDVDGVILTGYIHGTFNPTGAGTASNDIYPAFLDPKFAGLGLAPGYLTTKPNTRGQIFYYAPTADPAVIAIDEQTKDLVTDATFATFFPTFVSHESNTIHVPVLLIVGQFDFLLCDQILGCTTSGVSANETSFFDPQAQLRINIIPNTGHDINLHTTAGVWFGIAQNWLKQHFDN